MTDSLPASVLQVIAAYRALLAEQRTPPLRGLYLVGSLALGDYRPGASDIDFVALLDDPPKAADLDGLAQVHGRLAEVGGPCFDGVYLHAAALRQPTPSEAVVPFSVDGRFRSGEVCREVNPVVWRCLARAGHSVFGTPPAELGIADETAHLKAHQIANLRGYWTAWIAECEAALAAKAPGEDCNGDALAWGVLGVSRIACTLATDRIVSKGEGGRFALDAYADAWHRAIREALAAHASSGSRVSVESVRRGLAFMRFIVDTAPAHEA